MRFRWFFIQEKKPAKGEVSRHFRRLEEVLDIEFPAAFFYPDLVPPIIDGQVLFDNLVGGFFRGWFRFEPRP